MNPLHENLTDQIINAFYHVYNELGYGFLEKVYQNALFLELESRGFKVEAKKQIMVFYKGSPVGVYYSDIVINDLIILELKAAEYIVQEYEFHLLNYLRASTIEVGLLLNFGKMPQVKRKVLQNTRKKVPSTLWKKE